MKKIEMKDFVIEVAGVIAGGFASTYCSSLLGSICPPVGIAGMIGKSVISSTVGSICGDEVIKKVKGLIKNADELKTFVNEKEIVKDSTEDTSSKND